MTTGAQKPVRLLKPPDLEGPGLRVQCRRMPKGAALDETRAEARLKDPDGPAMGDHGKSALVACAKLVECDGMKRRSGRSGIRLDCESV